MNAFFQTHILKYYSFGLGFIRNMFTQAERKWLIIKEKCPVNLALNENRQRV